MSLGKIAPLVVLVFAVQIGLPRNANAQSTTDIVIEWNRILQTTVAIPGALPATIFITRPLAILHVAMFDAVNSIDYVYRPYAIRATVVGSPSREVAAARAALGDDAAFDRAWQEGSAMTTDEVIECVLEERDA